MPYPIIIFAIVITIVWFLASYYHAETFSAKLLPVLVAQFLLVWLISAACRPVIIEKEELLDSTYMNMGDGKAAQVVTYVDKHDNLKILNVNKHFGVRILPDIKVKHSIRKPYYCGILCYYENDIFELIKDPKGIK